MEGKRGRGHITNTWTQNSVMTQYRQHWRKSIRLTSNREQTCKLTSSAIFCIYITKTKQTKEIINGQKFFTNLLFVSTEKNK